MVVAYVQTLGINRGKKEKMGHQENKLAQAGIAYKSLECGRTAGLIQLGRLCREYVESKVGHIPRIELARRKSARSVAVKEMDEHLARYGGKPQVNRWIKYHVIAEWYCNHDDVTTPGYMTEIPQGVLIHLSRLVSRNHQTEKWSIDSKELLLEQVKEVAENGKTAREVQVTLDKEEGKCRSASTTSTAKPITTSTPTTASADASWLPTTGLKKESPNSNSDSGTTPKSSQSVASTADTSSGLNAKTAAKDATSASKSSETQTGTNASPAAKTGSSTTPAIKSSPTKSAPSKPAVDRATASKSTRSAGRASCTPTATDARGAATTAKPDRRRPTRRPLPKPSQDSQESSSSTGKGLGKADDSQKAKSTKSSPPSTPSTEASLEKMANDAFTLLNNGGDMLASVFRRRWEPASLAAIGKNLVKHGQMDDGENGNLMGLAMLYHAIAPSVRLFFEETTTENGELKLTPKETT